MPTSRLPFAFLLLASLARAQPPAKPVPVVQEPFHKVTLENAWLRVIDVHFPPGATTLYHEHVIPSVVVELADATITSQEWGAASGAARHVVPGETRYAPYDEKPLAHRVTNSGQTLFHVLDIELLRSGAKLDPAPAATPLGMKLEWEQKLTRLYEFALAAGKSTAVPRNGCAHLVIVVSGSVATRTDAAASKSEPDLKAGEYRFFPPTTRLQIDQRGNTEAKCILLQLR